MGTQAKMKTKREQIIRQRGNALIYVLIAIALFAALSITLGRQSDTSESASISDDKAELYATQLISTPAQVKSALDQMIFSNTKINDFDFTMPNAAGFEVEPPKNILKVYHPQGGGITPATLPTEAVSQSTTDPVAGWYMGRFNNVDWTETSAQDVILVAFQINKKVCEKINMKITGTTTIPTMTDTIQNTMIPASFHTGANVDLITGAGQICPECHNRSSLCVQEGGKYGFYTVVADQ